MFILPFTLHLQIFLLRVKWLPSSLRLTCLFAPDYIRNLWWGLWLQGFLHQFLPFPLKVGSVRWAKPFSSPPAQPSPSIRPQTGISVCTSVASLCPSVPWSSSCAFAAPQRLFQQSRLVVQGGGPSWCLQVTTLQRFRPGSSLLPTSFFLSQDLLLVTPRLCSSFSGSSTYQVSCLHAPWAGWSMLALFCSHQSLSFSCGGSLTAAPLSWALDLYVQPASPLGIPHALRIHLLPISHTCSSSYFLRGHHPYANPNQAPWCYVTLLHVLMNAIKFHWFSPLRNSGICLFPLSCLSVTSFCSRLLFSGHSFNGSAVLPAYCLMLIKSPLEI